MLSTTDTLLAQAVRAAYFGFTSQKDVPIIKTVKKFKITVTDLKLLCRALTGYRKMLLSCMKQLTVQCCTNTRVSHSLQCSHCFCF